MSLEDRRVIAPRASDRRALARIVLTIGREYELAAFRAPDDHLHMESFCGRRQAGELVRRVGVALSHQLALPVRFVSPNFKPLADQRHAYGTCRYILRQDDHHRVDVDPWAEASNLPDLLGLRVIGAHTAETLRRFLPRITVEELAERLGTTAAQLTGPMTQPPPLDGLVDAAAAAAALPDLRGRQAEVVAARHAAVVAVADVATAADIAARLGVTDRAVRKLRALPADRELVDAIRRQLNLRASRQQPLSSYGQLPMAPSSWMVPSVVTTKA